MDEVKAKFALSSLETTATRLYRMPFGQNGLAGIVVEPSAQLHALQQAGIEAVDVYARTGGGYFVFVPDRSGVPSDPLLFDYVETFVPLQTGEKFNPHLTIGLASIDWLKALEEQPFAQFSFGAAGIATYQLGNFGTASRRLDQGG